MKKIIHNYSRGLTAAITVLVSCTGAANAAVEQNKGTNAIAFSEQRGDNSANLVLSTLDLALMDPVERDTMLASLETQFGKPKVWASRAARSTSKSVFGFARDGSKEKYGVRLRARELPPVFNSDVSSTPSADNVRASEQIASASLLGVSRSEALTWSAHQDDYLGDGSQAVNFREDRKDKWMNQGFNYKLAFKEMPNPWYSPNWYGFSIKVKPGADIAGRFEYNQWWYRPQVYTTWTHQLMDTNAWTRDVTGGASLGVRANNQLIISWGHDWPLAWAGYWGIGMEASVAVGAWPTAGVQMASKNTNSEEDALAINFLFSPYVEAQGTAWIGNTEHKVSDDDTHDEESHKLIAGARGQIVFQGTAGLGIGWKCWDYDWYNDKWNNDMKNNVQLGAAKADGKVVARGELRWGPVVFQEGYQIWAGSKQGSIKSVWKRERNLHLFDLLL
jgi:hypothetical protein